MTHTLPASPVVDVEQLQAMQARSDLRVIDARFDLTDADAGERAFLAAALPGARYLHLDRDLSDHSKPSYCGRHPLPDAAALASTMAALDILPAHQVVIHDAGNGAMAAARAWWLLRLLGYPRVAVLDGGFAVWCEAGGRTAPGVQRVSAEGVFPDAPRFDTSQWIDTAELASAMANHRLCLLDARAAERFRGEVEPLDAKAGHIPGAINRPFTDNLEGVRFKPAAVLRREFLALMGDALPTEVVLSCGSGVTACHNLLAMEHAGLHGARLYPPSWSGWIATNA